MALLDRSHRGEDVTEELDQLRGTIETVKAIYEGLLRTDEALTALNPLKLFRVTFSKSPAKTQPPEA